MGASRFDRLVALADRPRVLLESDGGCLLVCPELGGRTFARLVDSCVHRIDLGAVANPSDDFNNYGGGNFWPAPEGGPFGFNYRGDEWYVQPAINRQPFDVISSGRDRARIQKRVALTNRASTVIEAVMSRDIRLVGLHRTLEGRDLAAFLAYESTDAIEVTNEVSVDDALIACWTLEQFDASVRTLAFCRVARPEHAINFDYYAHPGQRITYALNGFTYRTDGHSRGQIGIRVQSQAEFIGFCDPSQGLVCLRENLGPFDGIYFNIADNEQPRGPYSAADNYSIFNSDPDMGAFELETVGAADVDNGLLRGSTLVSRTTFALFREFEEAAAFAQYCIGG